MKIIKIILFVLLFLLTKTGFSQETFKLISDWGNLPINEISIPGTHNSFSNHHDIPYQIPGTLNSNTSLTQQLLGGVRAIELDVHKSLIKGDLVVSHSPVKSALNAYKSLSYFLDIIRQFLLTHTDQFLVLKLQNFTEPGLVETELKQGYPELIKLVFIHSTGMPVPTLNQLLKLNKRLIVIMGSEQYGANLTQVATTGDIRDRDDIYLEKNYSKGPSNADLFNTTNYNTSGLGGSSASDAAYNNDPDRLETYCIKAWAATGKKPFRITVDYAGEGDIFKVANNLNNNYYPVKGEVRDQSGKLLDSVTWNIRTGSSIQRFTLQNRVTYGRFSFPLSKHNGLLQITPLSDKFKFSPATVTINLDSYSKTAPLKITATPK